MTIEIKDYDANWPVQYEARAASICDALGGEVMAIEHVGSTSVPGLAAKPVLDVLVTVLDSAVEAGYCAPLESMGFELKLREPEWFEHRMFFGSDPSTNLHVFSNGCPEITRMLVFRDWLRANPKDRTLYEQAKRRLALQNWHCVQDYADAKSGVVAGILLYAHGG